MNQDGKTEFLGELHDMSVGRIIMRHSHGSRQKADYIKRLYDNAAARAGDSLRPMLGESLNDSVSFMSAPEGYQRLIETWGASRRANGSMP